MALTMNRRRWQGAAALAVAAAGVAGALVWFTGDDGVALDQACAGTIAAHEVSGLLGDGDRDVDSEQRGSFGSRRGNTLSVRCQVQAGGGRVAVTIKGVPRPEREHGRGSLYTERLGGAVLPVPVGHGWSGILETPRKDDESKAIATLSLDCARDRGGLLVTVETSLPRATADLPDPRTVDDPATRLAIVRAATATAANADRHWDCGAKLGRPVRSVGLPVAPDEYEPLLDADGTCRGVPPAARLSISTAWETASGGLREECALGTRGGAPRFWLEGYYGPYAEEVRAQYARDYDYENVTPDDKPSGRLGQSGYWASAECPGTGEPALYMVEPDSTDRQSRPLDLAYERTALRAFAEHSAKRHGCEAPVFPER
ncbi:hypothetical protein ACZ90_58140 [Streptomyces albus subsp. albus]|nr:hypothetical protein ACZ90_58140 [Streptomyces albus subsp. albus]